MPCERFLAMPLGFQCRSGFKAQTFSHAAEVTLANWHADPGKPVAKATCTPTSLKCAADLTAEELPKLCQ